MTRGYALAATSEQDTQARQAALAAAGCERVFAAIGSGGRCERPEQPRLPDPSRAGDTLAVRKLGRSSRSIVGRLQDRICRKEVEDASLRR